MRKEKYFIFERETPRFLGRELNEDDCVYKLKKKGCHVGGKTINIERAHGLGNGSWGMISFLCRFLGYECVNTDAENPFVILTRF
jgi:hypothetical protein